MAAAASSTTSLPEAPELPGVPAPPDDRRAVLDHVRHAYGMRQRTAFRWPRSVPISVTRVNLAQLDDAPHGPDLVHVQPVFNAVGGGGAVEGARLFRFGIVLSKYCDKNIS